MKPTNKEKIYIIKKLWLDSMENHHSAAIGYKVIGYLTDKYKVDSLILCAGSVEGDGYPIKEKVKQPRLIFEELSELSEDQIYLLSLK